MVTIAETTDAPEDASTPYTITPLDSFRGEIDDGQERDRDWVRVNVEAGYGYAFEYSGDGSATSLDSTFAFLYDSDGNQIAAAGGADSLTMLYSISPADETVYVELLGRAFATGTYTLDVIQEIGAGVGTRASLAPGETLYSTLETSGDLDWVRIELQSGYNYIFNYSGDGSDNPLSATGVALANAAGNIMFDTPDTSGGASLTFEYEATRDQNAYVILYARDGVAGDYALSYTQDILDSRNTRETLAVGDTLTSSIEDSNDSDWVRVELEAGEQYRIITTSAGLAPGLPTSVLRLHDNVGSELTSSSGNATNVLEFEADTTGVFYISVNSYNASTGDYDLFINNVVIPGTDGPDLLTGTVYDDEIMGFTGNDTLLGGAGDDSLEGGAGADRLDGGTGDDTMDGGLGNDRYIIDSAGDVITGEIGFSQGGGIDTVESWISYTLPRNVEILRLQGTGDLNGTGGFAPEALVGQAGNNVLDGGGGNDVITAKAGDDTLIGGLGADSLVGDAGADVFVFNNINESRPGQAGRDFINGFENGIDRIDLSGIDANTRFRGEQDFRFLGKAEFTGLGGEVRWFTFSGGDFNIVEADVNGDRVADMQIFVNLTSEMFVTDFIL